MVGVSAVVEPPWWPPMAPGWSPKGRSGTSIGWAVPVGRLGLYFSVLPNDLSALGTLGERDCYVAIPRRIQQQRGIIHD